MPADMGQQTIDFLLLGNTRTVDELPGVAQDARGDIEPAIAQVIAVVGEIEQARGFRIDLDAPATVIDLMYDIVVTVAAELLLDAQRLLLPQFGQLARLRPVVAFEQDFAGARHAVKLADPEFAAFAERKGFRHCLRCYRRGLKAPISNRDKRRRDAAILPLHRRGAKSLAAWLKSKRIVELNDSRFQGRVQVLLSQLPERLGRRRFARLFIQLETH